MSHCTTIELEAVVERTLFAILVYLHDVHATMSVYLCAFTKLLIAATYA